MKVLSRTGYYAASILTLLTRFERPFQILGIFLGRPGSLPTEIQLKQGGYRFSVREAMDVWVIKETCVDADYLPVTAFRPDWTVVDIGAGLGDFTVLAAAHCPVGRVFAYEPLAASFDLLQHNLALNGITNAAAFQQATASTAGTMSAVLEGVEAVSTRFTAESGEGTVKEAAIPVITLAEMLDRLPNGRCDLMKIDCEGCEFDLLLDSPPGLLSRIDRLTIETHDGYNDCSTNHLAAYLRQQGFSVRERANPVHDYLGFIYAERHTISEHHG
ncbi:MAG: FkbM family methyltransferase [Candidatus Promineifilaceae bacterium]